MPYRRRSERFHLQIIVLKTPAGYRSVDAQDSKSRSERSVGSSPTARTTKLADEGQGVTFEAQRKSIPIPPGPPNGSVLSAAREARRRWRTEASYVAAAGLQD